MVKYSPVNDIRNLVSGNIVSGAVDPTMRAAADHYIHLQSISKAAGSQHKLLAMPSWKQGVMRQGGPADTMVRRIVATDFTQSLDNNPYAFANMQCASWRVDPGTNVYYPGGVCGEPAINLSGGIINTGICPHPNTGQ